MAEEWRLTRGKKQEEVRRAAAEPSQLDIMTKPWVAAAVHGNTKIFLSCCSTAETAHD
jgi:hypothetical protein